MCMLPLLQLHGRSRTGRRHLSFQPLSLLRKALSTLLSGCRKLGRPLDKKQYADTQPSSGCSAASQKHMPLKNSKLFIILVLYLIEKDCVQVHCI